MGLRRRTDSIRPNFPTTTPISTRNASTSTLERFSALLPITLPQMRRRTSLNTSRLLPTRIPNPIPLTSTPALLKETTAGRSLIPRRLRMATMFLTVTRSEPKLAQFPLAKPAETVFRSLYAGTVPVTHRYSPSIVQYSFLSSPISSTPCYAYRFPVVELPDSHC